MQELKEENKMVEDSTQDEIAKLQKVLEQTLEESHRLRSENEKLQRQQLKDLQKITKLSNQMKQQKVIQKKLEKQVMAVNYRLENMQKKYEVLADSKLGQLTLNYWKWKGTENKKNILFFIFNYLFKRLPNTQEVNLIDVNSKETLAIEQKSIKIIEPIKNIERIEQTLKSGTMKMTMEQEKWIDNYIEHIAKIPESNGSRFYQKLPYRIGLICDEFFYESISAAADFIFLTPDNWKEEMEKGLDVLLFVSAWRGLNEEWRGLATLSQMSTNPKRLIAMEMLQYCKEKNIPTVFYSKEDPPNYEMFLDYARQCDYIFTSAKECIPYYKEDCNRERIEAVCFGINPLFHNPIGFRSFEKEDTVLFSGSWMEKYPDRCRELAVIFDGILDAEHGLHIIDRNYPLNKNYRFPDKYFSNVSPSISHDVLQKVHKLFDWAVNINSVKGSETMFANRSFELQANGVLLLSNFSVGVNSMLPTVQMVHDSSEVEDIMSAWTEEERYERQIAGIRSVMTGHTCFDRISQLLAPVGLETQQPIRRILVLVDEITQKIQESFEQQTYKEKDLLLVTLVNTEILEKYDMVTWFSDSAEYGVFYLEDMINAFKFTACDYITKDAWYEGDILHEGVEHNYVSHMKNKYCTVFWREAFESDYLLSLEGEQYLENGYSIDRFNYNAISRKKKKQDKIYLLSVIVPVYNNGTHLYGKCFASLYRSSMFQDMEIILVDDGSTDEYTLKIETYLEQKYDNVCSYRFNDGGSGSASRPRNKGVELATARYLTFLDPDNEAVWDGYAKLYDIAVQEDCDLVMGNMYKCDIENRLADYYGTITQVTGTDVFENGVGDLLINANFISASIQAMVIRTELIRVNGLEQVSGAAGQDTLFSWQLLYSARRIRLLDLPIHIYYAQTAGSVTNVVRPKFFKKLLLLQKPKADWLVEARLMDAFMKNRYNYYTKNWILKKLSQATLEDALECAILVEQCLEVFEPYYHNSDTLINQFIALCKNNNYEEAVVIVKEAFPQHKVRPMPTKEEILTAAKKPAKMLVEYYEEDNMLMFRNKSGESDSTYAWVILLAEGTYQKVYTTKYTSSSDFSYDFSKLQPNIYKVRGYMKQGEEKISDDIAFIKVGSEGVIELLLNESKVVKGGENNGN